MGSRSMRDFQVCNRIYSRLFAEQTDSTGEWLGEVVYKICDLVTDEIYSPDNTVHYGKRILTPHELFFDLADSLLAPAT